MGTTMHKGASDNAQGRRDRGMRASPAPKPTFKKEAQRVAKIEKKRAKRLGPPGSMRSIKDGWDD
jgi:hypothetical protein